MNILFRTQNANVTKQEASIIYVTLLLVSVIVDQTSLELNVILAT